MTVDFIPKHSIILWQQILIINYLTVFYSIINNDNRIVNVILLFHLINFSLYFITVNIVTTHGPWRTRILNFSHNCIKLTNLVLLLNFNKFLTLTGAVLLLTVQISWILFNYKCPMMMFYTANSRIGMYNKATMAAMTVMQLIKLFYIL